jgi:hypothetical protein
MQNRKSGRQIAVSDLRNPRPGVRATVLAVREGFTHGFTGQCYSDERELCRQVRAKAGISGALTAYVLQAIGEAYAVGRLAGAGMARDYRDMAPERRAALATTLWPARTVLPRTMEPVLQAVLNSFKRQPDAPEDVVPADGSGPVAQWW